MLMLVRIGGQVSQIMGPGSPPEALRVELGRRQRDSTRRPPLFHSSATATAVRAGVLVVALGTCLESAGHGQAQPPCRSLITTTVGLPGTRGGSDSLLQQWNELDWEIWRWLRAWFQAHDGPSSLGFPPHKAPGLGAEIRDRINRDAGTRRLAALALADIMRGEHGGLALGQDVLAAELYHSWDLPGAPALSVLSDLHASYRARRLAIVALEGHWYSPEFFRASVGALCILSVQVAGMRALLDSSDVEALVDEDQSEFLSMATASLLEAADHSPRGSSDPGAMLPPGNPVTEYIRREFCRANGCPTKRGG
jgi:hypothetical protein